MCDGRNRLEGWGWGLVVQDRGVVSFWTERGSGIGEGGLFCYAICVTLG
jgi:hypothetical protein